MRPEDWEVVQKLFEDGLALAPEDRDRLLSMAGDEEVAAQVRELWANTKAADLFFETAVTNAALTPQDLPARLTAGQQIAGRFTVLNLLGSGGMSEVYRARDERLGRIVALKVLPVRLTAKPAFRQRLNVEAQAVSLLSHPAICALYDAGIDGDIPFLVMEHLVGETLEERLARGPMPHAEIVAVARQLLDGLSYAHSHGIIHRDLKPSNIMLTNQGPKLLDFGIAKHSGASELSLPATQSGGVEAGLTRLGEVVGTIAYMSPEQARGQTVDARSDIFSFGCVLFEMASGERAFGSRTATPTVTLARLDEAAMLRQLTVETAPKLSRVIQTCLRLEPDQRFQSAAELRDALTRESGRRWPVIAGGIAVTLACVTGVLLWSGRARNPAPATIDSPVRLTNDPGRAEEPAISPDGRWVAYASDRSGNFDLYLKEIGGAGARQLTSGPFNERSPKFTPDGRNVVYESDEKGHGISVIPMAGGPVRHLAAAGAHPSVSPDGKYVTYSTGISREYVGDDTKAWIVPFEGGTPTRLFASFYNAGMPQWSGDGKHLFFIGVRMLQSRIFEHWVSRPDGSDVRRMDFSVLAAGRELTQPSVSLWKWTGNLVYGSSIAGHASRIVAIRLDAARPEVPLSARTISESVQGISGLDVSKSGLMAFGSVISNTDLYRLRLDHRSGRALGELERLTDDPSNESYGSVSEDGRTLCYISNRDATTAVWVRDLSSGADRKIAQLDEVVLRTTFISPDGRNVVYQEAKGDAIVVVPLHGGTPKRFQTDYQPSYWLDNRTVVGAGLGPKRQLVYRAIDIETGSDTPLPGDECTSAYSPASLWVCTTDGPGGSTEMSLRYRADQLVRTYPLGTGFNVANFSAPADGSAIYWTATHNGHDAVFGVRLAPKTAKPIGPPFLVYEFHGRLRLGRDIDQAGPLRAGSLILAATEASSNIWLQQLHGQD